MLQKTDATIYVSIFLPNITICEGNRLCENNWIKFKQCVAGFSDDGWFLVRPKGRVKKFTLLSEKTNIDCFSSFSSAFMGVMFTRPSYRLFIEDATGFCRYVTYFLLCHKLIFLSNLAEN